MMLVAIGLYMGLAGFQQYAVESSRSMADTILCAPNAPVTVPGRAVAFEIAGLPPDTSAYWSAPEGRAEVSSTGAFSVIYSNRGTKTVSAFFRIGDLWERTSCTVAVQ